MDSSSSKFLWAGGLGVGLGIACAAAYLSLQRGSSPAAAPAPAAVSAPMSAPAVATSASTAVIVAQIHADRPVQRLDGFGAATAYYQNWIFSHPYKQEIYDALFKGLKLDILRLQNVWRPTKGADFASHDLDIVQSAQASLGHPIAILLSSWAPPADLKNNHSEKDGGTLARKGASGPYVYKEFGQYWADSLGAYRKLGIVPTYISLQNEPDWKATWESCLFKPTEQTINGVDYAGYDKAQDAVYQQLQSIPGPAPLAHPQLIGAEPTGIAHNNLENFVPPSNTTELNQLYAVAHHLYNGGNEKDPDTFLPALHAIRDAYPNKTKMQTEFGRGDLLQTAWLIHNCMVEENASAYIYWAGVWPYSGEALIHMDNPLGSREKWKSPHGWQLSEPYWAIKHYAYFTAPGWHRVETQSGNSAVKLSAFISPDGKKLTAVLINTSSHYSNAVKLDLTAFSDQGMTSAMYCSTSASNTWRSLGALSADRTIVLPPHSVITVAIN